MPLKPSMETPIDLIAFEHYFGHFFEAFPSFYNMQQPVARNDCTTSCSFIFRPFLSVVMTRLLNSNMHILCGSEYLYAVHFSYEKQMIGSSINEFCFGMLMFWFQY